MQCVYACKRVVVIMQLKTYLCVFANLDQAVVFIYVQILQVGGEGGGGEKKMMLYSVVSRLYSKLARIP